MSTETTPSEKDPAKSSTPVLIIHGVTQFILAILLGLAHVWAYFIGLMTDSLLPLTSLLLVQHTSTLVAIIIGGLWVWLERPTARLHIIIITVLAVVNTLSAVVISLLYG